MSSRFDFSDKLCTLPTCQKPILEGSKPDQYSTYLGWKHFCSQEHADGFQKGGKVLNPCALETCGRPSKDGPEPGLRSTQVGDKWFCSREHYEEFNKEPAR